MRSHVVRLLILFCGATPPAFAQTTSLAAGSGKDLVETACANCHSLSYIPMNSHFMTPDAWQSEVTRMRTAFGAPIDDDAANAIVAYLVANYGQRAK